MFQLILLGTLLLRAVVAPADVELVSDFAWWNNDPQFGGLSGIEVSDDGNSFVAIGDRGMFIAGTFVRKNGAIVDVTSGPIIPMHDDQGGIPRRIARDAEGLAIGTDGQLYVSFEAVHEVRRFDKMDGPSTTIPRHPDFGTMQNNSSLEALAIGPDGALYTLPERSGRATRPFPVYRMHDGVWDQPFDIPRRGAFLVSGADVGPDNKLYILERDFTGFGFRSRVRRFNLAGGDEETLLETMQTTHDNLEGISVWRDDTGALRITMIADDNFRFLQRTEIIEYRIND